MKNLQVTAMAVILLLVVTLSGCIPWHDNPILPMPPDSPTPPESTPKQMTVDVYWDATISMQGYTKLAAGNVYRTLPDTLGDMVGSFGAVNYFRFGEQVVPVEGREYRRFSTPDYYTELITSFGSVLDAADSEHLSIVVTDLFESEADWSNVTQKLREKYFSKHLSVAIIGIKNSFSGEIYDVGLNAANFSHDSGDDPTRFRPFYLFLMGSEPQIRAFLDMWEAQNVPAEVEVNKVLFSEHFALKTMAFRVSDLTSKKNLILDSRLRKADDRLQEVGIAKRNEKVELTIGGKCQLDPYACPLSDKLDNRVKVFAWNENDEGGEWQQQSGESADVSFTLNGDNCELTLKFSPNEILPQGRISLLQVLIVPSRQSTSLPMWITDWDMGDIDIAPDKFDGSKTVNLQRIATSLKDSLLTAAQPTIAELNLVIDGR